MRPIEKENWWKFKRIKCSTSQSSKNIRVSILETQLIQHRPPPISPNSSKPKLQNNSNKLTSNCWRGESASLWFLTVSVTLRSLRSSCKRRAISLQQLPQIWPVGSNKEPCNTSIQATTTWVVQRRKTQKFKKKNKTAINLLWIAKFRQISQNLLKVWQVQPKMHPLLFQKL